MINLANCLHRESLQIETFGLSDRNSAEDKKEWYPVPCHGFERKGPAALGYSPEMVYALLDGNYDLLHTHGIWQWPSFAVHAWYRKLRKPYFVSPHGMLDPWALANSRWKKRVASWWYETEHLRDASCVHALCRSEAESIRAYGLKNPICIIPNGVNLPETRYHKPGVGDQRSGRKILLFLGRLHPKKGLVNALRAWAKIGRQDEWQIVIAGWDQGGHRAELEQLCEEVGLSVGHIPAEDFISKSPKHRKTENPPSVLFIGPAFGEIKDALLRKAEAFILPSFSEGLPMSVLEAWSYQLPVLMTDHCNLPEGLAANACIRIGTMLKGQEALGIRHQSALKETAMPIEEGLRTLFEMSDSDRIKMGRRGRLLVEQQFTWPQVAVQMKEVYQWILGGGTRPACLDY